MHAASKPRGAAAANSPTAVCGLCRQHLSLELSLGIAFFVDLILMAAALAFIASGVNIDIFTWGKEAFASLKSDDNEKVCLLELAAPLG